ncbi:hypothetical protein FA95DRAFT_446292 [Auriscalpium vulgare]|uniref:Uncharacterized protein n=1 Tax=Auriscalpium vulgare TaxID=40419 RepID=A0ACB8RG18_9AGAM|nr:hypothetical protein FA95DRAFT_446292 [Auriscalpium vulgare]
MLNQMMLDVWGRVCVGNPGTVRVGIRRVADIDTGLLPAARPRERAVWNDVPQLSNLPLTSMRSTLGFQTYRIDFATSRIRSTACPSDQYTSLYHRNVLLRYSHSVFFAISIAFTVAGHFHLL